MKKARLSIVAALHDVRRNLMNANARAAGNLGILAGINTTLPLRTISLLAGNDWKAPATNA
jgi:hypothetical protein